VFSDNTYLTYQKTPPAAAAGTAFRARFTFRMPILPVGDYMIAASVAQGTQQEHVQLHWLHEALLFRSHSSSVCTGLAGVPMESIVLESREREEA
jgi:lipopolysaccharide transport system ATP-binding protein